MSNKSFEYLSNKLAARIMTVTIMALIPFAVTSGALAYYNAGNGLSVVFGIMCGVFSIASLIIIPLTIVYWHDVWLHEMLYPDGACQKKVNTNEPPPKGSW